MYNGVYDPPPPRGTLFQARSLVNPRGMPTPNETSPERSRMDASIANHYGTDTTLNCRDIEHGKSVQGCVVYTVLYGTTVPRTGQTISN